MEGSYTQTETYTKESGKTTKRMVMVNIFIPMVRPTRGTGLTISNTATEKKTGLMEPFIRATISTARKTAMESLSG